MYNAYVEEPLLEKKGLKALYKILQQDNDEPPIGTLVSKDSRAIIDQDKADMLAKCFSKVFCKPTDALPHNLTYLLFSWYMVL